jgi:hypothetical protein
VPFSYSSGKAWLTARPLQAHKVDCFTREQDMTAQTNDPAGRDAPAAQDRQQGGKTPNPDMQPEDAGSTDSGTEATRAMKQTSKTPAETKR